ncbi:hypothetical protein JYP51_08210 [Ponticoccus gilvus]|nr:hypothetical protein [Enemella evansiae]
MIRPARPDDIPAMLPRLLAAARDRAHRDPALWPLSEDAAGAITASLQNTLNAEAPPFRQQWLLSGTGLAHGIHLPVPPIYAGRFGAPGLLMEDSTLAPGATGAEAAALLAAAEADLRDHGARILLAASLPGGPFEAAIEAAGYQPLTLYYARSGLRPAAPHRSDATERSGSLGKNGPAARDDTPKADTRDGPGAGQPDSATAGVDRQAGVADISPGTDAPDITIQPATQAHLPGIATRSAESRAVLHAIDAFWEPHPEAATRFGAWMARSQGLTDRDMFVSTDPGAGVSGYVIAQPVTPLHVPPGHALSGLGIVDDWHHVDLADPARLAGDGGGARALLQQAETALATRGRDSALVVCPAGWLSKRAVLRGAGYRVALTWYIRR